MKTFRLAGVVIESEEKFVYDLYEVDSITAKQVNDILENTGGEDITLNLNSPGGSVFAGVEIYSLLRNYSGHVTVNVTGLAASIASVIMLGADTINISNGAQIMIHNPSTVAVGSKEDLKRSMNSLDATERTIANLYANKAKQSPEEFLELMNKETWLTSDEALEMGLVDNITHLPVEDDLQLIDSYHETMVALANFKQHAKLNANMEDVMAKSLIEKLKNALSEADDIKNQAETVTEEIETEQQEVTVETDNTEVETEESSETDSDNVEETSEDDKVSETEDVNAKLADSLEKATEKIEELTNENQTLKNKLSEKDKQISQLQQSSAKLEQNIKKATNVIDKFNALLEAEDEEKVEVVNTANHENPQSAFIGRFHHKQD